MSVSKLTLLAGASESFEADFENEDGTPMDLAGLTIDLVDGQNSIACSTLPIAPATVRFSFSPAQTAAMQSSTKVYFRLSDGTEVKRRGPFWIIVQ